MNESDQLKFVAHKLYQSYLFFIPWGVYFVLDLFLTLVTYISPTFHTNSPTYILYLIALVVESILLVSVVSYTLIKILFLSKRVISHIWQRFTPPFKIKVPLYSPVQLNEDEVEKSIRITVYGIMLGLFFAVFTPMTGEFPLRYGSVSFTQLPDLPYSSALTELLSGLPIVGDLLVLDLISSSSTIVYIPISVSVFLFILGLWNFSYLFMIRDAAYTQINNRIAILVLKTAPYLTPILALISYLSG